MRLRHPVVTSCLALAVLAGCTAAPGGRATQAARGRQEAQRVVRRLRIDEASFSLPAPVQREVAVAQGGAIYLAGGLDSSGASVAGVFEVDPGTGRVRSLGSMTQPFHDAAGAVLGGRLVVFGGGTGESSDAVQAFDLSTRRAAVIGHLPEPLSDLSAVTLSGTVYLVGGWNGSTPNAAILATSDGVRFRTVGHLPEGLRYASVAAAGDAIVVAGGMAASGRLVASVSSFDTSTGRVVSLARLPAGVAHSSAFVLGGDMYVAGGQDGSGHVVRTVLRIDPRTHTVARAPSLPAGVADGGSVVAGGAAWILGGSRGAAVTDVVRASLETVVTGPPSSVSPFASPPERTVRPFAGLLLIADRGNNRLLVMDAAKHLIWRYPAPGLPPPPFPFYFPDDAFWVHGGHAILVSEEENDVVQEIAYPSGQTLWSYGRPRVRGAGPGALDQPDDVYPYPGGGAVVADARNCRLLFFGPDGRATRQIGLTGNADVTGSCFHDPPDHVGYPNGDTPLPNGDLLVSELRSGGWVDELSSRGVPVWQTRVPGVHLPSDPQPLPDGSVLTVDYETPGRIVRFTPSGRVLWDYFVRSGHGELSNPSLAAPLPNDLVAANDDYRDRVIVIDPATNAIVWQYGHDGRAGRGPGYLDTPDGFDLLFPDGTTPLHLDFASSATVPGRP